MDHPRVTRWTEDLLDNAGPFRRVEGKMMMEFGSLSVGASASGMLQLHFWYRGKVIVSLDLVPGQLDGELDLPVRGEVEVKVTLA